MIGFPQPLTDGVGTGQPGEAAELSQSFVHLNLPDIFQRPATTTEHQNQGKHILLGFEPVGGARRRQVLFDTSSHAQHQRGFLKQGQSGPTSDGIAGRRKLEIEPFLCYTASNHLAASLFT